MAADKFALGKRFCSFAEVESALNDLRKDGSHPLCVYNSHKGEDYNRKQLSRKYPNEPVHLLQRPMCTLWPTLTMRKGVAAYSAVILAWMPIQNHSFLQQGSELFSCQGVSSCLITITALEKRSIRITLQRESSRKTRRY